jgi:hypothetical protein
VLVRAGAVLYKLTQHPLINGARITTRRCFVHSTNVRLSDGSSVLVPGWETARAKVRTLGGTDAEFVRARSAVFKNRNRMSCMLRVRMNVDAYGWFGLCAGQPLYYRKPGEPSPLDEPTNVFLVGGGYQLYIPNLNIGTVTEV